MGSLTEATQFGRVQHTRAEGVLEIVLADSGRGNAITHEWVSEIEDVLATIGEDDRCVLIRAEGRNFCVGGDITAFGNDSDDNEVPGLVTHLHAFMKDLHAVRVPIVSAVQGAAAGAGFGVACAGDIVICADNVRFKSAYLLLGLTPDAGLTWRLPRAVGLPVSLDLLLTDRELSAVEAERLGLVSRVVAESELAETAQCVVRRIASGPREAAIRVKDLARRAHANSLAGHLDEETVALTAASASGEGREGIAAFLERRPARFQQQELR